MKYIGQSINIHKRWQEHKRELNKGTHHNNHLQNAWTLYGAQRFTFRVLEICDKESLDYFEKHWVDAYGTMDRKLGYNIGTPGSGSMANRHHTKESREKMSRWQKKHTQGKDNGFYGKKHSKETLEKISNKLKGRFAGEKNPMYGKVSPMRGKSLSDESRKKMSDNHADVKGSKHPKAKLTEEDVKKIIELLISGERTKDIAKKFKVNPACIGKIKSHINWTHLTDGIDFKKS